MCLFSWKHNEDLMTACQSRHMGSSMLMLSVNWRTQPSIRDQLKHTHIHTPEAGVDLMWRPLWKLSLNSIVHLQFEYADIKTSFNSGPMARICTLQVWIYVNINQHLQSGWAPMSDSMCLSVRQMGNTADGAYSRACCCLRRGLE